MTKQELINELARLYRLQDEGKNVWSLIAELEVQLYQRLEEDDAREIQGQAERD